MMVDTLEIKTRNTQPPPGALKHSKRHLDKQVDRIENLQFKTSNLSQQMSFGWPKATMMAQVEQIGHRTHKRFEYRCRSNMINLTLILTFWVAINSIACLDSPVKVQRYKQQVADLSGAGENSNIVIKLDGEDRVDSRPQPVEVGEQQQVGAASSQNHSRIRRTNNQTTSRRQQITSQLASQRSPPSDECPSIRLINSLLPAEYLGSPAISQRPAMSRAHCDCTADPYGWHLTCFAANSASLAGQAASDLPNQLHPAFRAPQLQRQQQQQQQSIRRIHRSPVRWMGDEHSNRLSQLSMSNSSSNKSASLLEDLTDELSPTTGTSLASNDHEGFGEDTLAAATSPARPSASTSDELAAKKLRGPIPKMKLLNSSSRSYPEVEAIASASSSDSFFLMQPKQQQDNAGASDKLLAAPPSANNINQHQQHLTFQTVPVLFSIKYLRNNMIEIDCDQAAPNYKPAMLQGFSVNEISSFTFNNCQLPNIPFSVLLHRSRALPAAAIAAGQQQAASLANTNTNQQVLKPNRLRHQNLVKRNANFGDNQLEAAPPAGEESAALLPDERSSSREHQHQVKSVEPRIKFLAVNLNTVVDQRTLISLLTGLDLLEELQLNYMQLNLTNFDRQQQQQSATDPLATNPTTSAASEVSATASLSSPAQARQTQPPANQLADSQPLTTTSSISTTTSSSSSSSSSPATTTTTTTAPSTQLPQAAQPLPTVSVRTQPQSPTTTTSATPTTTVINPNRARPRQQPIITSSSSSSSSSVISGATTILKPAMISSPVSVTATRPSISLGAPRGLVIAQATGIPTSVGAPTTTKPPTTTTSTTSAPISTTVPSLSLTTVVAASQQARLSSSTSGQRHPQNANNGHSFDLHQSQSQSQSKPSSNLISVSSGQPSVSYTSFNQQQSQPVTTSTSSSTSFSSSSSSSPQTIRSPTNGQQTITVTSTSSSSSSSSSPSSTPPATSTLISGNQQQLTPSRLHSSPSAWVQSGSLTTPSAGTRLSAGQTGASQANSPTSSFWGSAGGANHQSGTTNGLNEPANTPFATTLSSNGFGIRASSSAGSLPASLSLYNSQSPNNHFRSSMSGLGLRTLNSNNHPLMTTSMIDQQQSRANGQQQQQSSRQQTTTNANNLIQTTPIGAEQFVAAGGRLPQNRRHQQLFHQPISSATSTGGNQRSHQFSSAAAEEGLANLAPPSPTTASSANGGNTLASAFVDTFESQPLAEVSRTQSSSGGNTISHASNHRFKRQAGADLSPAQSSFEEFELSFGELLPNLRSLKLESFIDLSQAFKQQQQQQPANKPSRVSINRRFRRQFQPSDLPEHDEGHMSDSESEAISASAQGDADSLVAEETSMHHNSVMLANGRPDSPPISSARSTRNDDQLASHRLNNSDSLISSASNERAHTLPVESGDSELESSAANQQQQQQQSDDLANSPKVRHLSQLLVRMFSKLNKLKVLQLTSNEIPYWPDQVLQDSRNSLVRLYLISNNIRQLGRHSLANHTELETLDLSSNQLRQLNAELFRDLSNLRNLRACRNLFRKLPPKLFGQLDTHPHHRSHSENQPANNNNNQQHPPPHHHHHGVQVRANRLESVDFSKNRYLGQLSADLFGDGGRSNNLAPVASLNLSDCVFTDQLAGNSPESFFASLPDLVSVSLRSNKLRQLLTISGLFAKNSRLQRIDVSHNQLSSLSANLFNANASQIVELYLHHNQLSQIPDQFLFNLRKLKRLSLAHNRLQQLSPKMFFTNHLVEQIDLSHNQLINLNTQQSGLIPFGNGANLRYLSLAYNNLSQFEGDIFEIAWSFYTNLHTLDLAHNKFQGQIGMPIFYTIADEMLLNLASNNIQSVSVEALMQHEQVLDRYATFEASADNHLMSGAHEGAEQGQQHRQQQQQAKVPTVNIRLAGNPISCDCMLEPLISYSRRVAAATNPTLVASIFPASSQQQQQQPDGNKSTRSDDGSLPASSRYSVLTSSNVAADPKQVNGNPIEPIRQPQLFYQFKFNDLYCAKPSNLQRRLLSHISIGDLLCPIKDERLCPSQCQCHYQSAFKTAIVDCNNRQLVRIPDQLTDSANFFTFNVESSFGSPTEDTLTPAEDSTGANSSSVAISSIEKVIIRLDNNKLSSMEPLSRLFRVVLSSNQNNPQQQPPVAASDRNRFARAPKSAATTSAAEQIASMEMSPSESVSTPAISSFRPQQEQASGGGGKRVVASPVAIGRTMHGSAGKGQLRSRRQADLGEESTIGTFPTEIDPNTSSASNHLAGSSEFEVTTAHSIMDESNSNPTPMSTSVLESAEEFRNKHYPLTCELYLDHNLITTIPQSFLEILDQIQSSSMQSTAMPPQAALPTQMLEPPIHTKLNNVASALVDQPERASGGSSISGSFDSASVSALDSSANQMEPSRLFGRQPLAPERKAALMETISQNVRLNQMQQQQQQQQRDQAKAFVTPSLMVLSLRYNNLSGVNADLLGRLSKLIKSSNTKLYLGHNPFNCSDNYRAPVEQQQQAAQSGSGRLPAALISSPLGDQLIAASDASSGAYLESTGDDLLQSAASSNGDQSFVSLASGTRPGNELVPLDCPVGQLKTWLTRHHSSIGDLDELYCVHMPPELAEHLRLASNYSSLASKDAAGGRTLSRRQADDANASKSSNEVAPATGGHKHWDHDHPWASSLMLASVASSANGDNSSSTGHQLIHKEGFSWNGELLANSAKLIELNMYDLCPHSGNQLLDPAASGLLSAGHQRALLSVAIMFILISLCLLLMLVYFGDTQTILAFVYIHMNPIYSCLHLSESHLDGEKLYDAFVSYSSADRDIVMELIEKLEQQPRAAAAAAAKSQLSSSKGLSDRSHDSLVTEADLNLNPNQIGQAESKLTDSAPTLSRRTSSSFQDLSTMSRSTSRIIVGGNGSAEDGTFGGSALDLNGRQGVISPDGSGAKESAAYRLCIHERDWLPGHLISWNIVNSVQNSRRTILILSKDFIKSVWFQVEFHTAYYQMLEDKIDRLIVIVRGELPPKSELDKNLAFLLTTKTYLTWGEKWFWERLHYALPHRAGQPPTRLIRPPKLSKQQQQDQRNNDNNNTNHHHHHHRFSPRQIGQQKLAKSNEISSELMSHKQRPLIMSSIGKDCSNLLLPAAHQQQHQQPPIAMIGSSSSAGSASSSNTRSSSSSFLSGSSTGNLLIGNANNTNNIMTITTTNDLLSTSTANNVNGASSTTTRLTIGGLPSSSASRLLTADSGHGTGTASSATNSSEANTSQPGRASGITSILLDGTNQKPMSAAAPTTAASSASSSKMRAIKQEKLQNFVDKTISDHFNLSEL